MIFFIFQTCVVGFSLLMEKLFLLIPFFLKILIHVNLNLFNIENTNKRRFQNVICVNELF